MYFVGRTENSIKNRFYSTLRRKYNDAHNNKFGGGESDNLTINTTISSELLKYLPDALMEKLFVMLK